MLFLAWYFPVGFFQATTKVFAVSKNNLQLFILAIFFKKVRDECLQDSFLGHTNSLFTDTQFWNLIGHLAGQRLNIQKEMHYVGWQVSKAKLMELSCLGMGLQVLLATSPLMFQGGWKLVYSLVSLRLGFRYSYLTFGNHGELHSSWLHEGWWSAGEWLFYQWKCKSGCGSVCLPSLL